MAEPLNLVEQRFGKLTVIERADNTSRGNTRWRCKCDCGNEKIALGYDLTHGRTVSCGCINVGKVSPNRLDIVGEKYNTLTVISRNKELSKPNATYWNCVCDCGAQVTISNSNLRHKKKPSHRGCPLKEPPYNFIDLTNKKFGRLLVVEQYGRDAKGKIQWKCKCDCGGEKIATSVSLSGGRIASCGCLLAEQRKKPKRTTHNMSKTDIYKKYRSMLNRCSPEYHAHKDYYDRGINVCTEWIGEHGFEHFREWSYENGYDASKCWTEMTLDRIDNSKGYSPQNCRWTTEKEQQNNKSTNVYIEWNGKRMTLKQWSEKCGLNYGTLKSRLKRGWRPPRLFDPPQIKR